MPIVRFQETPRQHAQRLGVTLSFTDKRRHALVAHLTGCPLPAKTPKSVLDAPAADIMRTLAVAQSESNPERVIDGSESIIHLVPVVLPATSDLLAGRRIRQHQYPCLVSLATPCTEGFRLPYGYRRERDGAITPDPAEAEVVRLAFELIVGLGATEASPLWQIVADRLNARGYRRRYGQIWRGRDVRALTRTTTYAGYVRRNRYSIGDAVERFHEITQPLLPLDVFVRASAYGCGKGERWHRCLKALIGEETI